MRIVKPLNYSYIKWFITQNSEIYSIEVILLAFKIYDRLLKKIKIIRIQHKYALSVCLSLANKYINDIQENRSYLDFFQWNLKKKATKEEKDLVINQAITMERLILQNLDYVVVNTVFYNQFETYKTKIMELFYQKKDDLKYINCMYILFLHITLFITYISYNTDPQFEIAYVILSEHIAEKHVPELTVHCCEMLTFFKKNNFSDRFHTKVLKKFYNDETSTRQSLQMNYVDHHDNSPLETPQLYPLSVETDINLFDDN